MLNNKVIVQAENSGNTAANGELHVHQHNTSGILVINSVISNSNATILVKDGAGTLRLGVRNVLPDASAVTVSGNAAGVIATLDLNGNSDAIDAYSGPAITDRTNSGASQIAIVHATPMTATIPRPTSVVRPRRASTIRA